MTRSDSGGSADTDRGIVQTETPGNALATRVLAAIEPVARRARSFIGFFGWMSGLSLASALVISLALFLPFTALSMGKLAAVLVVTLFLTGPGLVLVAFRFGLVQIVDLPDRLASAGTELAASSWDGYEAMTSSGGGRLSRLLGLVRSLAEMRSLLSEGRDLLFSGSALVRVANPIVLVVVLVCLVVSSVLIAVASVIGIVAIV